MSADLWSSPAFARTNYVIAGAWAAAFALMVIADLALMYLSDVPGQVPIIATVASIVGAVKFSDWYPRRSKKHAAAQ